MNLKVPPPPASTVIPVDDQWRGHLGPPVFGTMAFALAFFVYTAPLKETPAIFDHAPWLNDPFDTVISFMILFVPLMALACVPRILLCRRHQPMPAIRIRDILRGCRVVVAGATLTLAVEGISVALQENRRAWDAMTFLQIGLLAVMSAADVLLMLRLRQVRLPTPRPSGRGETVPFDWLGDAVSFLGQYDGWFGPLRRPVRASLDRVAAPLEASLRKRPVKFAALVAAVFGVVLGVGQGIRETYRGSVTVTAVLLLSVGMFGLLVAAGSYLGLVRSSRPWRGVRRRLLDAAVLTSIGVLVPFALRSDLWWIVGTTNTAATLSQLNELLAVAAGCIFMAAFVVESLLGVHSAGPGR